VQEHRQPEPFQRFVHREERLVGELALEDRGGHVHASDPRQRRRALGFSFCKVGHMHRQHG
jgi:hypothetical protein